MEETKQELSATKASHARMEAAHAPLVAENAELREQVQQGTGCLILRRMCCKRVHAVVILLMPEWRLGMRRWWPKCGAQGKGKAQSAFCVNTCEVQVNVQTVPAQGLQKRGGSLVSQAGQRIIFY